MECLNWDGSINGVVFNFRIRTLKMQSELLMVLFERGKTKNLQLGVICNEI